MQVVIALRPPDKIFAFKQSSIQAIFAAEAPKVEAYRRDSRRLLEVRIHIRGKTPTFAHSGFAKQRETGHRLKFIEGGQVRVEDIPAFSLWIRQEASIAKRKHLVSAAPKAPPREYLCHGFSLFCCQY